MKLIIEKLICDICHKEILKKQKYATHIDFLLNGDMFKFNRYSILDDTIFCESCTKAINKIIEKTLTELRNGEMPNES